MVKKDAATKFLRGVFNTWAKGKPISAFKDAYMVCSADLHEAFWSEVDVVQRFTQDLHIHGKVPRFKGLLLFKSKILGNQKWWAEVREGSMIIL